MGTDGYSMSPGLAIIKTDMRVQAGGLESTNMIASVYSGNNPGMWLYDVTLMHNLALEEHQLIAGRFKHFKRNGLFINNHMKISFPYRNNVEEMVTWIAENCHNTWAIYAVPHHVSFMELIFSFVDEVDAVHFVLRWR